MNAKTVYALAAVFASCLVMFVVSIVYATNVANDSYHRSQKSQQQFCALLITLDDAYKAQPPPSALGRTIAREMHDLRVAYHC